MLHRCEQSRFYLSLWLELLAFFFGLTFEHKSGTSRTWALAHGVSVVHGGDNYLRNPLTVSLSEKAVTLHQKCVVEKLDWARTKHAPVTHLCPYVDASKSRLRWGFFSSLQHYTWFGVVRTAAWRTDPFITAGLSFLTPHNTDVITSLKELRPVSSPFPLA